MRTKQLSIAVISLGLALGSSTAEAKDKKKPERGMLESMQSVPCGAKERGVTGLGSIFGSVGVEHVNSHEQLCPQYLLRTDEMEYHIRPVDLKHAEVLPVGQEAVFKLEKGQLMLRVKDGDKKDGDKSKYKRSNLSRSFPWNRRNPAMESNQPTISQPRNPQNRYIQWDRRTELMGIRSALKMATQTV